MRICHGKLNPLGATWDSAGVNFSLFSANANQVELFAAGMELNEECWNNAKIRCFRLRLAETSSRNWLIAA